MSREYNDFFEPTPANIENVTESLPPTAEEKLTNDNPPSSQPTLNIELISITFLGLMLIASILALVQKISLYKHSKYGFKEISSFQRIPCYRCRYFNGNPYLKCAVKPEQVLTDEAINCPEYMLHEDFSK